MLKFIQKLFGGTKADKDMALYRPYVAEINRYFEAYKSLSHDELRSKTLDFRTRINDYLSEFDKEIAQTNEEAIATEDLDLKENLFKRVDTLKKERDKNLEVILKEIMPEAFAVVKETSRRLTENETLTVTATEHDRNLAAKGKSYVRIEGDKAIWQNRWMAAGAEVVWNMVHYDVQLIGGMVLHDGKIAEMATGEGKTLVSTLPSYLNGLSGSGVHVVTVNDYLARRDSEWNGPLFEFLFLTVDCIDKYQPHSAERIAAYKCDIVYGTNNEFGFDYLRDNMIHSPKDAVQGKHHFAMVDEVDSVLIDDARTPLIIAGPTSATQDTMEYLTLKPEVERLIAEQRRMATEYLTSARKLWESGNRDVEEGSSGIAMLRAHRALPKNRPLIKFFSEEGVRAHFQKAENNFMQDQSKRMKEVDKPLLFVIDEKNRSVELTENGAEFLSKSHNDASFFVMPDITTKMMEIDKDETLSAEEKNSAKDAVAQDFSIKSQRLHSIQQLLKAYTLFEKEVEYVVIENEVKIVDEQTGRMMEGRRYSDGLHQALEAKENVKLGEATQTHATITLQNYFRMYHKLAGMTGTAETEAGELWQIYKLDVVIVPTHRPTSRKDLNDLVYKTKREKINAIIEEITRLTAEGRPVLVGTKTVDDSEVLSRSLKLRGIAHNVLNAKQHQREAEIVAGAGQTGAVTIATNMAGRGTDIKLGEGVRERGGLAIVGSERHDSRRVDRQLRGRAGRQGDPGSSQFFVSLEDELMRLFQSERIASMMDRFGHTEGEVMEHSIVTKSIERAQKKVEENNFGMRKRLLEYDDVMNIQRDAIYKKRFNALNGERLALDLDTMFLSMVEEVVLSSEGDYQKFRQTAWSVFGFDPDIKEEEYNKMPSQNLIAKFKAEFDAFYHQKAEKIGALLYPRCLHVQETYGDRYSHISVPYTDGRAKMLGIGAELKEAIATKGKSVWKDIEKAISLSIIDDAWKEHLRDMDDLKESVQGASFEQKDPLVIYKMEAYNLFETLIGRINYQVTSYLSKGMLVFEDDNESAALEQQKRQQSERSNMQKFADERMRQRREALKTGAAVSENIEQLRQQTVKNNDPKIGRNDPCPCGSGKKYKNCHGAAS